MVEQSWFEINIKTIREAEEAINNVISEFGFTGVVVEELRREDNFKGGKKCFEDPVMIKCYLPCDNFLEDRIRELETRILELNEYGFKIEKDSITVKKTEENWLDSWKSFFKPKRVNNVIIKPTWENIENLKKKDIVVELDPEMAFGTGLHPTTEACLRFLQLYFPVEPRVLDLGCGSGILSIACAKLGASIVYAYDLSPEACKVTKNNSRLNHVTNKIKIYEKDITKDIDKESFPRVELALGNLNTKVLLNLFEKISPCFLSGGIFILSGIIVSRRESILDEARRNNFILLDEESKKEWLTLVLKRN